jgi:hypothetical protein
MNDHRYNPAIVAFQAGVYLKTLLQRTLRNKLHTKKREYLLRRGFVEVSYRKI